VCFERHKQFSLQTEVSIDNSRNIEEACAIGVWEPLNTTASLSRIANAASLKSQIQRRARVNTRINLREPPLPLNRANPCRSSISHKRRLKRPFVPTRSRVSSRVPLESRLCAALICNEDGSRVDTPRDASCDSSGIKYRRSTMIIRWQRGHEPALHRELIHRSLIPPAYAASRMDGAPSPQKHCLSCRCFRHRILFFFSMKNRRRLIKSRT